MILKYKIYLQLSKELLIDALCLSVLGVCHTCLMGSTLELATQGLIFNRSTCSSHFMCLTRLPVVHCHLNKFSFT